jgi:hypothetical protein
MKVYRTSSKPEPDPEPAKVFCYKCKHYDYLYYQNRSHRCHADRGRVMNYVTGETCFTGSPDNAVEKNANGDCKSYERRKATRWDVVGTVMLSLAAVMSLVLAGLWLW